MKHKLPMTSTMEVCKDCKIVESLNDGKRKLPNQVPQGNKVAKED